MSAEIGAIIDRIGLCGCGNPQQYVLAIHAGLILRVVAQAAPETK